MENKEGNNQPHPEQAQLLHDTRAMACQEIKKLQEQVKAYRILEKATSNILQKTKELRMEQSNFFSSRNQALLPGIKRQETELDKLVAALPGIKQKLLAPWEDAQQ